MSMQQIFLTGMDKGLVTNAKPMLIPDKAWQNLYNCYCWRQRVLKREGLETVGRLERTFTNVNYFLSASSPWTFTLLSVTGYIQTANNANPGQITTKYPHGLSNGDLIIITGVVGATGYNNVTFTVTVIDPLNFTIGVDAAGFGAYVSGGFWISNRHLTGTEANAEINPGSFTITIGTGGGAIIFDDNGDGTLSSTTPSNSGRISYITGQVTLTTTATVGTSSVISYGYYPNLPVMGAPVRQSSTLNVDQTIFFDQLYAYVYAGSQTFTEWIPGTIWSGSNSQFFWGFNYRGAAPQDLLLFVTNFNIADPMRYTDTATWTNFAPLSTASDTIFQARIIISYYGRLLLLNTWEGPTSGGAGSSVNITNRMRFSALGSPVDAAAFRTDIFGKGGLVDAPTNQAITGATYIKNTLVVDFETETWQLRYVGEYGQPFVWERVSADFGSPCTFSGVLFDNYRLAVGDTAITAANAVGVERADPDIPDQVFQVQNENNGVQRVFGIREYQKELVYWNYSDASTEAYPGTPTIFPNNVFVYNYRNKTWAIFRDNVTCFSTLASTEDITWDSQIVTWDDNDTWDDFDSKVNYDYVVSGNQQGFVHYYASDANQDAPSLIVQAINLTTTPIVITSPNHNLQDGEIIQLNDLLFLDASTFSPLTSSLNGGLFQVQVIDANNFGLFKWDFTTQDYYDDFPFTPVTTAIYAGGGTITLLPAYDAQTKDFNIYASKGLQTKISSISFLMEVTDSAAMTVNIFTNSALYPINGNVSLWSTHVNTSLQTGFNQESAQYCWFNFYATASAQYFNINLTLDDNLKNTLSSYQQPWTLYGINANCMPGGRMVS